MRFTPQSASSCAWRASWEPLVVTVTSSSAPESRCRERERNRVMMPLRTKGSPPVMRILRVPRATKAEQSRSSSSRDRRSCLGRKVMSSDMQ